MQPASTSILAPGEHRLGTLLIFDTHPIQYRSPVFRALSEKLSGTKVFYFSDKFDGNKWWFHEVGKIPTQAWDVDLKTGYESEVIETEGKDWRTTYRKIRLILERERPDGVMTYGYYLPEHWVLRRLCAKMNIPLIFVGESFSTGRSRWRRLLKKPLLSYFFSGVHQFIAIGNKTAEHYRALGIPEERITRGKYCVDVSFFQMEEKEHEVSRAKWREENRIPADAVVVLFVGRMFERKRPWDVFAVHSGLTHAENLYTVMVGTGPQEALLQDEARRHPNFRFLGFQNQTEVRNAYHGADILLVPSEYETWGLVVNEAFSAGATAIVTDTCGCAGDLVVENQTGYITRLGDTETMTRHIAHLVQNPQEIQRMGQNAKKRVTEEYGIDQFADSIIAGFKQGVK